LLNIASYLIGSIPLSVWLGKLVKGIDVREFGSKGTGATNTFRILGTEIGIVVLLFDILKGISLPIILNLLNINLTQEEILIMGIYSIIGHVYPLFSGLRGGKGVATTLGVLSFLYPLSAILTFLFFLFIFFRTKYISFSSILSSFFVPISLLVIYNPKSSLELCFAISIPMIITFTHRKNIMRLIKQQEPKFKLGK
jgi:acyl phosphate:glycerol-3-phosphate acyltransferase